MIDVRGPTRFLAPGHTFGGSRRDEPLAKRAVTASHEEEIRVAHHREYSYSLFFRTQNMVMRAEQGDLVVAATAALWSAVGTQ